LSMDIIYPLVLLGIGILTILVLILVLRVNAFLALVCAALLVGLLSPKVISSGTLIDLVKAPQLVASQFGDLMGRIGIPIALAAIIGLALMESGGADRIVRSFTNLFGEGMAPMALMVSGFVLAVPVFFDTVFLLLVPLARAMYLRTGKNYLMYVVAIGAGGAVTHSLVPPTPGPIAMSETLHVDLGMTILVGLLLGFPLALIGLGWAAIANKLWPTPLRQVGHVPLEELEREAHRPASELPGLFVSLLPIVLPVVLIATVTVYNTMTPKGDIYYASYLPTELGPDETLASPIVIDSPDHGLETGDRVTIEGVPGNTAANGSFTITVVDDNHFQLDGSEANGRFPEPEKGEDGKAKEKHGIWYHDPVIGDTNITPRTILSFIGDKNIALLLATIFAIWLVIARKAMSREALSAFVATALDQAGMILLITCAGGAFGAMLREVGVGDSIRMVSRDLGIAPLVIAWVIAALMKIAQGSGTVSMITTSAMMVGILSGVELGYHPVYIIMAIGCGSKVVSWMNDSGFWVVCRMGGLTEWETVKGWTVCLGVMGVCGLPLIWVLTKILPLV
jgi:GntP family gluconate:H+ symporter